MCVDRMIHDTSAYSSQPARARIRSPASLFSPLFPE